MTTDQKKKMKKSLGLLLEPSVSHQQRGRRDNEGESSKEEKKGGADDELVAVRPQPKIKAKNYRLRREVTSEDIQCSSVLLPAIPSQLVETLPPAGAVNNPILGKIKVKKRKDDINSVNKKKRDLGNV